MPIDHLEAAGNYLADKRPDTVVCLGDFSDMASLSSYDVGKASAEGKRYSDDVAYTKMAMSRLIKPMDKSKWKHRRLLVAGNHEHRIVRETEANPRFRGTLSIDDLGYKQFGWDVRPFLEVAVVDGISYAHYFVSGEMGRPVSSASALLKRVSGSAVQGHIQRHDIAIHPYTQCFALFAGIFYQHDEAYLTPQGNNTRRGIWMVHEVHDGRGDLMFVSMDFLRRKYL